MELLTPDLRCNKLEDITPAFLQSKGFTALLIDVDNTLVSRATGEISSSVLDWIESMKQAGIACCLLSNNWHKSVLAHAKQLDVPIIRKAMKPFPVAYIRALITLGAHRTNTVVVGDQIFTDILGARLCVIQSILVDPLSTTDLWYTKIFRKFEQHLPE